MAQYTFTVNDRTASGRNLIQYLNGLSYVNPVRSKKELNADILRAMKMIRGVESVKPITNWKNCVTPSLAKKIDKAHRDSEQGKTLSFATAADAQCWMDAL